MKILIIHTQYKFQGGEDSVVMDEMNLLQSNGIEVHKLSFKNEGNTLLKVLQMPFNISAYLKTKKKIKLFKPDIVHIHNLHFAASTSVIFAVKKLNVACVFTLHNYRLICPSATLFYNGNIFLASLKSNFPWSAVSKGVYNNSKLLTFWLGFSIWLNRKLKVLSLVDRFILLTEDSKKIIANSNLNINPDKISIKPNFTSNLPINTFDKRVRGNHFLYIGRLSKEKGIDLLLDAFKSLPYSLKIIGDGPLKNSVISFAKNNANVDYLGFQDKETIATELLKCTALVFPSIWFETFGLTIIEAFANSTPVIAANIGAPSSIIEDEYNGLLFEASNVEDFTIKLITWQKLDDQKKLEIGNNAQSSYKKYYTPEKNLNLLLDIYYKVLNVVKPNLKVIEKEIAMV